jgi:hypothetical protein
VGHGFGMMDMGLRKVPHSWKADRRAGTGSVGGNA